MDYLDLLYDYLLSQGIAHPDWMLAAMAGALTAFFVQLHYWLGRYGGLPRFRNNRGIRSQIPSPPVSVVVVIRENGYYFIENYLPLLLGQRYDEFEVIAVDCSYDEEIGELLHEKSLACSRLHVTAIKQQRSAGHGTKLALTVGIKACSYEHIVFTTTDCYPSSDKWLSLMAKGFINGDIVIGYCGIERRKGLANRLIRCSRLAGSVRWLSAATRGRAYRGIAGNIGYTKSLYFESRGFNYLNMEIGDDDLFIQKIATPDNVSVVMNPAATMRQVPFGGLGWWRAVRRFYAYSFRYYPARVKRSVRTELSSRLLFFALSAAAALLLPLPLIAVPLSLVLIRLLLLELKIRRIGRRVGERGLAWAYILHDFWAPVGEFALALGNRIRPNRKIWR